MPVPAIKPLSDPVARLLAVLVDGGWVEQARGGEGFVVVDRTCARLGRLTREEWLLLTSMKFLAPEGDCWVLAEAGRVAFDRGGIPVGR